MDSDKSAPPVQTSSDTETRRHHKFGPSRLEYLDHCAAFMNRENSGNEYSEEGDFLHDCMKELISQVASGAYKDTMSQLTDWLFPNNELTDEQQVYLRFCCRRIDDLLNRKPTRILAEIPIEVKNPDDTQLNHGYLDAVFIWDGPVNAAVIVDFKFGWIPVPHALENLQGLNYTLGIFQMFPAIQRIGVKFMQPKLNLVTEAAFERSQMFEYYERIKNVIETAIYVQEHSDEAQTYMSPGSYCDYCALKGSCAVLIQHRATMAAKMSSLPVPVSFNALEIHTPEQWALARYWCEVVEKGIEELKSKAREIAENNGGELRCTLPNGQEVVYEIKERNTDRVLGSAIEVADALKDWCSLEEILGAADLALGKLTTIATNSMVEIRKGQGEKLTKKAAKEQIESTLTALGLLSQPDTKIRYLKLKKHADKALPETTEQSE